MAALLHFSRAAVNNNNYLVRQYHHNDFVEMRRTAMRRDSGHKHDGAEELRTFFLRIIEE